MSGALQLNDQTAVANSDPAPIISSLSRYASGVNSLQLSATHPYQNGYLPSDNALFRQILPAHVIEAIAVRGPLHCADGWGYLARAISALLAGNAHSARHLAYYAELRAALSILASSGIGVFDKQNRAVSATGTIATLASNGTHVMAWRALRHWGQESRALDLMLKSINLNGVPLVDALKAYFPAPPQAQISSGIIKAWGFDLSLAGDDKEDRNISSYSPNDLTPIVLNPADDVEFVAALWECFEPGSWLLEKYLLRTLLELALPVGTGMALRLPTAPYANFDQRIQRRVSNDFLQRVVDPTDHPLIATASSRNAPTHPNAMIARAALLLRISTSMARANLDAATVDPISNLQPWWQNYGQQRGFWEAGSEPEDMSELWLEITDAIQAARATSFNTRRDVIRVEDSAVHRLCETERIALWQLCG